MPAQHPGQDYVHPKLGQEITAIGGHYVFGKEIRLPYNGREVLYFVGYAVLNSTCCGVGGCAYVLVPGFIQAWKYKKSEDALVSKIEPIHDSIVQQEIRRVIQRKEMVYQVNFW
ncbi:MAG: hypothetical protein JSU83_02135 [Deltaproteobacteria bacterium]|nr:MAG: hypothetical protein JSU83_02135 [Deltaproteobacteria bacterium]